MDNTNSSTGFTEKERARIMRVCSYLSKELDDRCGIAETYRSSIKPGDNIGCYNIIPAIPSEQINSTNDIVSSNKEGVLLNSSSSSSDDKVNNNKKNGTENSINISTKSKDTVNFKLASKSIKTKANISENLVSKRRKISDENSTI